MMSAPNSPAALEPTTEGERPLHRRTVRGGKKSPSGHRCMSGIHNIGHSVMTWQTQTASRGQAPVPIYRHSARMYPMKEKQGGPIPMGPKRLPLKPIKHPADTTCVPPSPAGPKGRHPPNLLHLINLKF